VIPAFFVISNKEEKIIDTINATLLHLLYLCRTPLMITSMRINYDHLGILTSILCAVHCTVLPLLISSLPLLGIDILESPAVEWALIGLAFAFGFLSLNHGYRRHHRRILPALLFCAGFLFLIINQVTDEQLLYICIPGAALLIISAHITNIRYCRHSRKCESGVKTSTGKFNIT
jgi:hypothetical protein